MNSSNEEPTIGDVLLAIANLETKLENRLDNLDFKVDRLTHNFIELTTMFAKHLQDHA